MNYWTGCITEAFEESGIIATQEQIDNVVAWVEGAHENYGMARGYDVIRYETPEAIELKRLKKELEARKEWELKTTPCSACITTGIVKDGWGRDVTCFACDGKGRL